MGDISPPDPKLPQRFQVVNGLVFGWRVVVILGLGRSFSIALGKYMTITYLDP